MNSKNNLNFSHIYNYTQNIVLLSVNELKKENSCNNNENESNNKNNGIQHMALKSQNRNNEQINKNIKASNNNPNSVNIIVLDRPNIIRVKKNFEEFSTSKM